MERWKGKYMCLHFLVLIIQIFDNVLSCPASKPTMFYVSYCPRSQEEWEKAAQRKNCESIAVIQNCTTRSKFQYHCLMNQWKNATLEVCAPIFYLQGYCAEYNIEIKQVAEIYDEGFECLKFPDKHKCPPRYPSNEAYKYQRCYRNKITKLPVKKFTNSSKDNSLIPLVFILIVLLLFGIVASVVVMLNKGICDKLTKGCQQTNKNSEQNKKDLKEEVKIAVEKQGDSTTDNNETGEETGLLTEDRNIKDSSDVQAEEITITKKETEKQATNLKEEVKIAVEKQGDSTTDNNETGEETGLLTEDRNIKDSSDVQAEEITITKKETEKQATNLKEEVKITVEKQGDSTTDNIKSKHASEPPQSIPSKSADKKLGGPERNVVKNKKTPPPRPATGPKLTARDHD